MPTSYKKKETQANVDVKYLPWICVLSVDVIRFRLQAFANKDHCLRSERGGKSGGRRGKTFELFTQGKMCGTHRVRRKTKLENGAVELKQIQQFVCLK
jgi:hypothetical protein